MNSLLNTDGYKVGHKFQYPKNTEYVYSNWTPRKSRVMGINNVVHFGLQHFIKKWLIEDFNENFFNKPKSYVVAQYKRMMDSYLGKDTVPVDHIEKLHSLGYLPLRIKSLPEGSLVPMRCPAVTIINTNPEFYWLTNYIETMMSAEMWGPTTSATIAREYKKILTHWARETGADESFIQFQAHDFSMRGMYGVEAAKLSGMGHLTSFVGTDTIPAIVELERYYGANSDMELVGCSVPATEHAVMCCGGQENEIETFRRLIEDVYPSGIVSVVSDSWDLWKVCTKYLPKLKDKILARNGKLVIRPDSGDPVDILCGHPVLFEIVDKEKIKFGNNLHIPNIGVDDSGMSEDGMLDWSMESLAIAIEETVGTIYDEGKYCCKINGQYYSFEVVLNKEDDGGGYRNIKLLSVAEQKGVVELLWDVFGGTVNEKGFKVLDPHIGTIYGDSITLDRAEQICRRLAAKGFASTNVVFGVGSYTYQYNTRDTFGFAMKATWCQVDGKGYNIFKNPVTDDGTKKSAKGLIQVVKEHGEYVYIDECTREQENEGELKVVFENGKLIKEVTLREIRDRVESEL